MSWALRSVGHRSPGLHAEALALAQTLQTFASAPARWIGRDTLRDLSRPAVLALATRKAAKKAPKRPA
ncbi:MAG: hypothetical protein IPI35_19725 [Deltaproteobacteria bacterium]|nr:hypothetical protein [Deltaproteobacteria bacterium]